MTNAPHLDRLKQLLAKAEKNSCVTFEVKDGSFVGIISTPYSRDWFQVTPAQFAQLKTEYPDKWRE